ACSRQILRSCRGWSLADPPPPLPTLGPYGCDNCRSPRADELPSRQDRAAKRGCWGGRLKELVSQSAFLEGVPVGHVLDRLWKAAGNELGGKFGNPDSSAALAVNTFGWFVDRPELFPFLPGMEPGKCPSRVEIEYCARFPFGGGRHPWLDAMVETDTQLV